MAGMINRVDHDDSVSSNGNSGALDTSGFGQVSFTAAVSNLTGSGATVQVELEASDDATNWNVVHTTGRMNANGNQRISGIRISAKYYRFTWKLTGTTPSADLKITTTLKDYSPTRTGSLFRYGDLDVKTIGALSTVFTTFSNTEVGIMVVRGADGASTATIKLQGSQDGTNWHDHTGDYNVSASQAVNKDFSGSSHKYFRLIVVTAATGGGSALADCLWNSTGGA